MMKGFMTLRTGNSCYRGGLSTVDLHLLTSLDQLLFILKILIIYFYKTNNLNKEVNCTKPSLLRILNYYQTITLFVRLAAYLHL
jgi:hypothetical protein